MRSQLSCSVFELNDQKEPSSLTKTFNVIDPSNRVFLRSLRESAKEEDLELKYKIHPFQSLRLHSPEKLNNSEFDADIAVCMYPDLAHVGVELAHMMIERKKAFRHVFIVTRRMIPDGENDLWMAIRTLPQASVQLNSIILEPMPFQVVSGEDEYDTEKLHIMSHWHITKIREEDSPKRIQSILVLA